MSNQYTWIMSKDKMILNGVSSDTVGIFVDTPPMPPMPNEIVEQNYVHGRAESNVYHTGHFSDITISVNCYVFDYGEHPDQIYRFLSGAKTLAFSTSDRFYYKVKQVQSITPTYNGYGKNTLTVRFLCSPFKYNNPNPEYVYTIPDGEASNTIQIYNAGSVYCEPVIFLSESETHSATSISVNGITVTAPVTTTNHLYIDIPRMETYYMLNGEMIVPSPGMVNGKWWDFIFPPGYSEITWSGTETIKIIKNERWL